MRVRIVDHSGTLLTTGDVVNVVVDRNPTGALREGVGVGRRCFEAPPSVGHCSVSFDESVRVPLWYGGTYGVKFLDFTLPSGLHNVWGCGNDFDTDSAAIHPDDLPEIMKGIR